jgi:hypothetical protein
MVIYRAKHLFGRYYQAHHLPYGHLEVHLRELEQALEEARHSYFIASCGGRATEIGGTACRPGEGNVWVHGLQGVSAAAEERVGRARWMLPRMARSESGRQDTLCLQVSAKSV